MVKNNNTFRQNKLLKISNEDRSVTISSKPKGFPMLLQPTIMERKTYWEFIPD